ncbi:MAG: VOC family protein [Dehalococcoidia bacterium]
MNISHSFVQLASPDRPRLLAFYRDVVGLPAREGMGPDALAIGENTTLSVTDHSEVRGATKEPARVIIDFMVDDIDAEQARLEKAGVKFTRDKGLEFWGGIISTFNDPDGNTLQLMQFKPELATEEQPAGVA